MQRDSAEYWISKLNLQPHPEGGFFRETYRSEENIQRLALPERFAGTRNFSTAIYFLLRTEDRSVFHRIKLDELWHFYAGSSLTLYILKDKALTKQVLGSDLNAGQNLQIVIPANCWFGAKVNEPDSFVLSGCTVSPGFDFSDFEIASREKLLREFSHHSELIMALT
jgi:predicted cupin superfamily sugar epimerase